LRAIADLIRRVRREVVALHAPDDGDNEWSLGCRAYARTCSAIKRAAEQFEWLTVLPEPAKPLRFVFAIGQVPIRFYRGDVDDPPARYLVSTGAERIARQMAFEFEGIPAPDRFLRIAVNTTPSGEAKAVALVEFDERGSLLNAYPIPIAAESRITQFPIRKEGVSLPPPVVVPIRQEKRKRDDAS
jgi:hypothetical protein